LNGYIASALTRASWIDLLACKPDSNAVCESYRMEIIMQTIPLGA